jgi:hypothetical protein
MPQVIYDLPSLMNYAQIKLALSFIFEEKNPRAIGSESYLSVIMDGEEVAQVFKTHITVKVSAVEIHMRELAKQYEERYCDPSQIPVIKIYCEYFKPG